MLKKFFQKDSFFLVFLGFVFLNDFGMFYSLYNYIFAKSHMSVFQISTILSVCQLGKILFDVPSGILNDKFNKKIAFVIGILAKIIAMVIFINYRNYCTFLIAMFFIGISWSCTFGKIETFLYSEISDKQDFSKKLGLTYSVINLSIAIANYISGKIIDINFILKIQIYIYIIALFVLLKIKVQNVKNKKEKVIDNLNLKKFSFLERIKDKLILFVQYLYSRKKVKNFIILSIFLESLFIIMIDLNTNLMLKFNFSKSDISKVVSIVAFIRIFTNLISGYVIKFINIRIFVLYFFTIFLQILFFTTFFAKFSFIAISVYLCFYTPISLFALKVIQENIEEKNRNLILSSMNMMTSILSIIIDFSFGFLGWINGIRLLSILLIIFVLYTKSHHILNIKRFK